MDSASHPKSKWGFHVSTAIKWKLMLFAALLVPVVFETLDYTVVATAQVHIASVFNRVDLQSYIGTVYLLTSTVSLPLFASLADVWGRHWSLQFALLLFTVGSAISTGAQNMATMLVGRGIAGIGAGGMMAVVRIILSDSRSLDDNNLQQSMLFFLFTIGYCVGPVIGGALTTVSFRWIFAINLPCCAVAIVLCFIILRGRTKGSQPRHNPLNQDEFTSAEDETFFTKFMRIDWVGALLFMGGGVTVLLALNWGSTGEWSSARVIACFIVSGVMYVAWVAWEYVLERKAEVGRVSRNPLMNTDPMIPLALFTSFDLCVSQYAIFVSGLVMLVMFYFVAIFFTIVGGLSGTGAGTQLLYFVPGLAGGSLSSMVMVRRLRQPKVPIVLGTLIITIALGLVSWAVDRNDKGQVNGFLVMTGVGVGMTIGPLAVQARFSQPEHRNAVVAALNLFSRALGGTVGLAQCGAVLNGKVTHSLHALAHSGMLSPSDTALLQNGLSSGISSLQSIGSLPPDVQQLVKGAFQQGTRWAFISLVPWSGLALVLTLFLSKIGDPDREGRVAAKVVVQEKEAASHSTEEAKRMDDSEPIVAYTQRIGHV
ncbi:MFS general substrate transporter [Dichomitus squalens LYAD-421 SS1]|uniref:MFS general substrate transporter n=1 Tax=Dichomitus squalens (strain LYAD-421) TaxID=732165 RepID=UPI0004415333|nr:MFS general substrate transporter [Dichomitus squalens LYAD-421 SS1]EJF62733.1 MFS general substrate transporter [Dichomitus squalens LYAD-421 SS1]